jgi:hypothetical protein
VRRLAVNGPVRSPRFSIIAPRSSQRAPLSLRAFLREIRRVLRTPRPPYALESPRFPFPALAGLAGRLPLGAGREPVLAVLLTARIASGTGSATTLSAPARKARAAAANQWLSATCPDTKIRAACAALAETSVTDDRTATANALAKVMEVTDGFLDAAARTELRAMLAVFQGQA